MKRFALFLGIAVALVASCSTQEKDFQTPAQGDTLFYASFEQPGEDGTKVYANEDLLLRWTADDRVSIFNKLTYNQQYKFTGETGDNAGGFRKVETDDFVTGNAISHIVSVYPYQETTKIAESEILTVTLPAVQTYAQNTFGLGANTMVSVSSDNVLQYKNVGGYLVFKLYGEDVSISSITLKGNNGEQISGKASLTMPVNGLPSVEMSETAGQEVSLVCDTPVKIGSTAETATSFWLVVPPTVFSKGFTLTVKDNKNDVFEKATSKSFDVSRNKMARMSPLKTEFPASTPDPDDFTSQYFTFEIISDGSMSWVSQYNAGSLPKTIEYSLNGGAWTEITSTISGSSISVRKGDILRFRGDNETYGALRSNDSGNYPYYNFFRSSCQIKAYGNIMSLISSTNFKDLTTLTEDYTFFSLFKGCENLLDVSQLVLPATTLTEGCYREMFSDCTGLMSAPLLPATTLADYCYRGMFTNCSSLQISPDLPATTLASHCYERMFFNCSNLVTVSDLPAITLADNCYSIMFYGCTSLLNTPSLPATNLADYCYNAMFQNCTNLKTSANLPATNLAAYCYYQMFFNCSSLTSAPELPATILVDYCYNNMFYGCTSLNYLKCLAIDISASNCTSNWVYNVASFGVFVKAPYMNSWSTGLNGIPRSWTVQTSCSENIETVDLGLSVKWANMNLGATKPEEYGDYFAWGETEPKDDYSWAAYKWSVESNTTLTKYCNNSEYGYNGFTDTKTVLDPDDDAAHVNLGGNWRMPTDEEWRELQDNCTWTWTMLNGVKGRLVTASNSNTIFLPASGGRGYEPYFNLTGSYGYIWSSSLDESNPCRALFLSIGPSAVLRYGDGRNLGFPVRPVCTE